MSDADAVIAALRNGHESLAARVATFSDEDLARPSGSSEWPVAQVLSHLGSGAEITQAGLQAALDGAPNPGGDFNTTVWDRWNAMSPREQADGFLAASGSLTELYDSLDADTRESVRVDLGFLPAPVDLATAGRMRLNELTLHGWDVHVAFDDDATLLPDATASLLHGEPDMTGWIAKPENLDGTTAVVRVETREPASVFSLTLAEQISKELAEPHDADGSLTLPAEAWLRLAAGRLSPKHTPSEVVATGAADLDLLRRVFPGY